MAKFRVAIFKSSSQIFIVEADNCAKAIHKISNAWDNGKVELHNPDICAADFSFIGHAEDNARSVL